MKNPAIVFNIKYFTNDDSSTANEFYRCKNSKNILSYISRESASENLSENDKKIISSFVELTQKSNHDILDYAAHRKGSEGVFNADGSIDKDGLSTLKKRMAETKSTIYSSVISFSAEDFPENFLTTSSEGRHIINNNIATLFKNTQFDVDNIEWLGAVHTNTAHRHIHFIFWEKTPTNIDSSGNLTYAKKHNLPQKNISLFKTSILRNVQSQKIDYYSLRDDIRNGLSSSIKNNKVLFDFIKRSCSDIVDNGIYQYARLTRDQKRKIDNLVKEILSSNPSLDEKYKSYKLKLRRTHLDYISLVKMTGVKSIPDEIRNFYSSRIDDLNSRLGNALLKSLKDYTIEQARLQPEGRNVSLHTPLKKNYNKQALFAATNLLKGFFLSADDTLDQTSLSLDSFKFEKLKKGEELIFDIESNTGEYY